MKKSIISILLVLVLCLNLIPASVLAAETVASGKCGENLTWTLDSEGTLTISGEGYMYNYDTVKDKSGKGPAPWSSYTDQITTVIVEDGVLSIGRNAFGQFMDQSGYPVVYKSYDKLESVSLPDTLTEIRNGAFWGCTALKQIKMSANLLLVEEMAFSACQSLEHIEFPDTCISLGGYLFDGCFALKTCKLPKGMTYLEDGFFQGCLSLESIELPESLTTIGRYAFSACQSLQNIDIPVGVRDIGDFTFSSISREYINFFTVTFHGKAPTISSYAFYALETTVYYPADDTSWDSVINQNYGGFLTWEPQENQEDTILYGDVNNDGDVTGKDLILLRQRMAGWSVGVNPITSDANADGKVDGKDLILLRQKIAGWNVTLGPKPEEAHPILGTWVYVTREDWEEDNIALVDIDFMEFHDDGTGWTWFENWSNYDLLYGRPAEGWTDITPPYSDNAFTYTLEGDQLTVTYAPIEDFEIEAETKVYTLAWNEDGSMTVHYPDGDERTYKLLPRDNMSLEELLELFGLDPNVPQPGDANRIVGYWTNITRFDYYDEDLGARMATVVENSYIFNADGTGTTGGYEWTNWDYDNGCPGDHWTIAPMGYEWPSFTYTLEGDRLTINTEYYDMTGDEPDLITMTEVYIVTENADGSITLTHEDSGYSSEFRQAEEDATVEELLELFGLDPNVPHSDLYIPGVDVDDVILWFAEVALDAEFSDGGDASVIQKWANPINYAIDGNPTEKDLEVLTGFVDWLNTIEGFPGMAEAEEPWMSNLQIHFCTKQRMVEILGYNFYGCDGGVTFWYYGNNIIYRSVICYSTEVDQVVRNSVILEEIYNGLGPVQDTDLRPDSICWSGYSTPQELTEVDELILKLLYHPSIQPGMNYDECAEIIRQLYY